MERVYTNLLMKEIFQDTHSSTPADSEASPEIMLREFNPQTIQRINVALANIARTRELQEQQTTRHADTPYANDIAPDVTFTHYTSPQPTDHGEY